MNNLYKIVLLFVLLLTIISCNGKLILTKAESDKDVVIRLNTEHQVLTVIQFPYQLLIANKSFQKKYFCDIKYNYSLDSNSKFILLYQGNKEIPFNGLKEVSAKGSINYFAYSAHFIYKSEYIQKQLRPYIDQMLELDQDTLAIKFVDFKNEHEELLKEITKFDSISIRTLKSDKSWDGERIAIPANW